MHADIDIHQTPRMINVSHQKLVIEVESRCIAMWQELSERRSTRVTLLVDSNGQFVIVMDPSNGFWFLPGGGAERNESIEETAKREALEELGIEIKVNRIITTFEVILISKQTKEQFKIPTFVVVHATPLRGRFKKEYAPNRQIIRVKKQHLQSLLRSYEIPEEYECMKPYYCISREIIEQLITS